MASVNREPPARRPTLRAERAAVTRQRILDAARQRFFEDGYAATTLKAVAEQAGVAVQTVYAVFGSKAAILAELRAMVVDLPEADAEFRAAMAEPTAERRLARFAHSIRIRWDLAGDIVKVNQDAARVDPSLRPGIAAAEARRHSGISALVRGIAADLDARIHIDRSIGVVNALTLHAVYEELASVQGWTPDAYEAWLADALGVSVLVDSRQSNLPGTSVPAPSDVASPDSSSGPGLLGGETTVSSVRSAAKPYWKPVRLGYSLPEEQPMSSFIDHHRAALADLCRQHPVRTLFVFGSASREDFDPVRSDVDLLVEFEPLPEGAYADAYFKLREALEDHLGRDVDLVAASAIRNPYVKADVERTRTLLYAA